MFKKKINLVLPLAVGRGKCVSYFMLTGVCALAVCGVCVCLCMNSSPLSVLSLT